MPLRLTLMTLDTGVAIAMTAVCLTWLASRQEPVRAGASPADMSGAFALAGGDVNRSGYIVASS